MKTDFYTYAYLREDGTPYYIGKGRGRRAFQKGKTIPRPPKDRILFLKTGLTEKEAFRHECYMIAVFGRKNNGTGILRNLTDGGEGHSGYIPTEETRKKISDAQKGIKNPKQSERMSGELNPMYGKTGTLCPSYGRERSDDTRKKISSTMTGKLQGEKNPMFGKTGDRHPRSKKVEVTYPEGTVKVFSSTKSAGKSLDCDPNSVSKWCRETCDPSRGKLAGHTFRYLSNQNSQST